MATFDEVVDKAKDAAAIAAQKSQEAITLTKKKIAIAELKRKIKSNYVSLGELYYNGIQTDSDISTKAESVVDEISLLFEEVQTLEDELLVLQNAISCPKCDTKNGKDSIFCAKCGAKL